MSDLNAVLGHLGLTAPAGSNVVAFAESLAGGSTNAVREPGSLALIVLGGAAVVGRRRKA